MKSNLFFVILVNIICCMICGCAEQGDVILSPKQHKQTGKFGYINQKGRLIIPFKYEFARSFSEGLSQVRENGKYGFIDQSGQEVIPLIYDDVYDFSEGLAFVKIDGKLGCIDTAGNQVIPFIYDEVGAFSHGKFYDGFANVRIGDMWYLIDKTGNPSEYSTIVMTIIGKVLTPNLEQIKDYRSKLNKSSRNSATFTINQPYLHLRFKANGDESKDMYPHYYSEYGIGAFKTEQFIQSQAIDNVKTLIIEYEYDDYIKPYYGIGDVTSIGSFLIYFDLDSKQCIGFDNVRGPELPESISWSGNSRDIEYAKKQHNFVVPDKIKSRLVNSEQ